MAVPSRLHFLRAQDALWLLLFSALAIASPSRQAEEIVLLICLALVQVLEPRIAAFSSRRGTVMAALFKQALIYLLLLFTGGVNSSYYPILVVPVVSAATTLGAAGTLAFTLLASASYASFLLFVDWDRYTLPPEEVRELVLRLLFVAVVGYLTYRLAEANRTERRRYEEARAHLSRAEAEVRRSERLAAIGQLAAGLAHELRNPLGTILASAEMLKKSVPDENQVAAELAGFIAAEVDRTNSLVTRFLEFARPIELRREPAELTAIIDRAVARLHRSRAGSQVTVYKNYSPDIRPFPMDAELIEQAIFNLLTNAAQASPPGGAITVKTRPAGETAEISVIDRGAGIEPRHLENIFNPFFTTRPDGVGLGLSIVSKIVDQHGGTMAVESEVGKGSVFRVFLPLRPGEHPPPAAA